MLRRSFVFIFIFAAFGAFAEERGNFSYTFQSQNVTCVGQKFKHSSKTHYCSVTIQAAAEIEFEDDKKSLCENEIRSQKYTEVIQEIVSQKDADFLRNNGNRDSLKLEIMYGFNRVSENCRVLKVDFSKYLPPVK